MKKLSKRDEKEISSQLNEKLKPVDEVIGVNDIYLSDKINPDKILENTDSVEFDSSKVIEMPKISSRKGMAKRFIALASTFAFVITGLSFMYIHNQKNKNIKRELPTAEEIVNLQKKDVLSDVADDDYSLVFSHLKEFKSQYGKKSLFSGFLRNSAENGLTAADSDGPPKNAVPGVGQESSSDKDVGNTNEQVQGVSEADIVKNDGDYIYVIRYEDTTADKKMAEGFSYYNYHDNFVLEIVKLNQDGTMTAAGIYDFKDVKDKNFIPSEMYIQGDRLIAVGYTYELSNDTSAAPGYAEDRVGSMAYYASGNTLAVILDISNRADVKLVRSYEQQGSVISTRMIGSALYLITRYHDFSIVNSNNYKEFIPQTTNAEGEIDNIPASRIYCMPYVNSPTYTVVSAVSVDGASEDSRSAILGNGDCIYASLDNLYVVGYDYDADVQGSNIIKFALDGTKVLMAGSGKVKGNIINQFSMDEHRGFFRIATTSYDNKLGVTVNNLYILDKNLSVTGKIENLAPDESIQSVRFNGDIGHVVTFKQIDPLFAIDLSNPVRPAVKSELKIPGFSSYMHPVDENTLVGVGTEGDDDGRTYGVKISLFDVTDPSNVTESSKVVIGGQGSYSEAWNNHKAVTYIESKRLLIVPVILWENNNYSSKASFSGFVAFKIGLDGTVTEAGRVIAEGENFSNSRSTYVDDVLYTVYYGMLQSTSLSDFSPIAEYKLG